MKIIVLSLLFVLIYLSICEGGKNNDKKDGEKGMKRARLTDQERAKLRENCRKRGPKGCREQRAEVKQRRQEMKQEMKQSAMKRHGISESEAEERTERRLQKIQNAKRAVMKAAGLEDIEPADDGLWGGDIVLNEEQADRINAQAEQSMDLPLPDEVINADGSRKKRNGIIFEVFPTYKWPNGRVPYYISPEFTEEQKQLIREGTQAIQAKTCIQFEDQATEPTTPQYIYFKPLSQTNVCGFSPYGMQSDVNEVVLSFASSPVYWMRACIQHEILHSLGILHTHQRYDRDNHITVLYENIDPDFYYALDQAYWAEFSSFGVDYEGKSMMHYPYYAFSINGQPTIVPKNSTGLSNGDLAAYLSISDNDAKQLNRMYSCNPTCSDESLNCGWWASFGYCDTLSGYGYLRDNCKKSCGVC